MNSNSSFECFGLVIHGYDLQRTLTEVQTRIANNQKTWIVTANPEILLYAKSNIDYWEALRQADLRTVDGFGLKMAGWLKGVSPSRIRGVDLAEKLAELCSKNDWTLALVGGEEEGAVDKAAWYLRKKYPNIKVWTEQGGKVGSGGELDEKGEASLTRLYEYEPMVVLAAFGHPRQEMWIKRYMDQIPTAKVFVGVGGTFYYWAGIFPLAPKWMQSIGFEWLYRLVTEPQRWKRILRAVVVFPLTVLFSR